MKPLVKHLVWKPLVQLCLLFTVFSVEAKELVVRDPQGDTFVMDLNHEESFAEVLELLESDFGEQPCMLDFKANALIAANDRAVTQMVLRNYQSIVSASEKADISFIVNTLGMSSLISITKNKSALKKAGQRIDNIHPLRFLMCVFTDEQMKASMEAMQSRNWIWDEFTSGLLRSLEEETSRNNLKEFLGDFATQLGISVDLISPSINKRQWMQFIKILIQKIPRDSSAGRYDM